VPTKPQSWEGLALWLGGILAATSLGKIVMGFPTEVAVALALVAVVAVYLIGRRVH
jgi:hypothetical protein